MSQPIITVSGVSKHYRLGEIGMTSLRDDLQRFAAWTKSIGTRRSTNDQSDKKDFWALKDVSFEVNPGEVIGIIGRNGAGKSTLLKILSRITEPTTGEIRLRGRVGSLLEVGTGFHPELSGRDNIFLNGAILGMTKSEIASKFHEIVAFAELEKFIDTPVKRYSSGMYVRLAFAIAAHLEPEILIVDEVLAVGDAQFQKKCIGRMQEISQGHGRTVLFVSHQMTTIRRLCQRCVVLDAGRVAGVYNAHDAVEVYNRSFGLAEYKVSLIDMPRAWGTEGRDCRFVSMEVVGKDELSYGQPMMVRFNVQADRSLDGMMLGLCFNTLEGQRVLTLDSDTGGHVLNFEKGLTTIEIGLGRLPLHPGRYMVSVSLGSGKHFYDIIDSVVWEVRSSAHDYDSDRSWGACRVIPEVAIVSQGQ